MIVGRKINSQVCSLYSPRRPVANMRRMEFYCLLNVRPSDLCSLFKISHAIGCINHDIVGICPSYLLFYPATLRSIILMEPKLIEPMLESNPEPLSLESSALLLDHGHYPKILTQCKIKLIISSQFIKLPVFTFKSPQYVIFVSLFVIKTCFNN